MLCGTVLAFAVTAWLARRLPDTPVARGARERKARSVVRDRRFVALTAISGAMSMHAFVLSIGLPLWLVGQTGAPHWLASLLLLVNTVLAVVLQVRMSQGSERPPTARRMLVKAGVVLAAVCLLVPLSGRIPGWAAAVLLAALVVVLTVGELWHTSGSWGLAVEGTPDDQRAGYLAFFNLGFTVATIVGPMAMGFLLELGGWGWAVLGGWFLALALVSRLLPVNTPARRRPPRDGRARGVRPGPSRCGTRLAGRAFPRGAPRPGRCLHAADTDEPGGHVRLPPPAAQPAPHKRPRLSWMPRTTSGATTRRTSQRARQAHRPPATCSRPAPHSAAPRLNTPHDGQCDHTANRPADSADSPTTHHLLKPAPTPPYPG
ncbi:hypothetical protein ACFQ2B_32310 [Streptomyces stramineus]